MALVEMAAWPVEEWAAQRVGARDLRGGLSEGARARLERAVRLEPGSVPRAEEWEAVLGHEKVKAGPGPALPQQQQEGKRKGERPAAVATGKARMVDRAPNGTPTSVSYDGGDAARPSRSGKRRRYNDESFEGYGEGFVDDDHRDRDEGGNSSDGGSRQSTGSRNKKRRKVWLLFFLDVRVCEGTEACSADTCGFFSLRAIPLFRRRLCRTIAAASAPGVP